jgi:hypothetical protein
LTFEADTTAKRVQYAAADIPGYHPAPGYLPCLNGGQPTVAERGIRVTDIVSRLKAAEPFRDVAYDHDLTVREVEEIRKAA